MTEPYWADDQITLYLGDCLNVLAQFGEASVDAIVTDPPYDLTAGKKGGSGEASLNLNTPYGRARITTGGGFMGKDWDATGVAFDPATWDAVLRVLKPGGHLLAFGGTRTWHRLTCAIEDAGFEIRDSVADLTGIDGPGLLWVYGQGFPKSRNIAKDIDAIAGAEREVVGASPDSYDRSASSWQADDGPPHGMVGRAEGPRLITAPATPEAAAWEGWGTALKPSWEPIVVARKSLARTVARNVLDHGTGALNIAGCQVEASGRPLRIGHGEDTPGKATYGSNGPGGGSHAAGTTDDGRWPPNVVLGSEAAAEMDRQSGVLTSGANPARRSSDKFRDAYGEFAGQEECTPRRGADSGGASRFFPVFRYQAKAGSAERPRLEDGTAHPTVKPVDLMAWLVRLVTPPGGLVLDPFAGSGATAEACIVEGFRCVLVEKDPKSAELIRTRLRKPIQPNLFGGDAA